MSGIAWNARMTFFAETSDSLIKSYSKKKILFQYDQFASSKVNKWSFDIIERGLRADPIARILLGGKKKYS
jgi:hypothetical protein